jgi:type IX secretion system PorP/SprF family membrane protein
MQRFALTILVVFSLHASAQQTRQFTQYIYNQFGHNPAVAGSKDCWDIKMGHREQWVGFDGAPQTSYISAQGRIKPKRSLGGGYHGVGAYISRDETGPLARTYVYGAYAYHVPISYNMHLGMGAFLGIKQYRTDIAAMTVINPADPLYNSGGSVMILGDGALGLWMYNKKSYIGLALDQVIPRRISGIGGELGVKSRIVPHINFTAGKRIHTNEAFHLIPSVMFKFKPLVAPSVDLNLMADFSNKFAIGLSYRVGDAVCALVKLRLLKYFDVGYSYDFPHTKMLKGTMQTHEITLGFSACAWKENQPKMCPAYD